jgi:hypothetical protein
MNSGATKPMPHPRGRDIFQRILDYPFEYWSAKRRSQRKAIAEFAVDYAVPDIVELVERVTIHGTTGLIRELWHC